MRYLAGDHYVVGETIRLRLRPKTYTCYPRSGDFSPRTEIGLSR
jgi:hypothetical protein